MPDSFRDAVKLYQSAQFPAAIEICTGLVALNPDSVEALHLMALCLARLGDVEQASLYFEKAAKIHPSPAEV